jgi:hypothetical protein
MNAVEQTARAALALMLALACCASLAAEQREPPQQKRESQRQTASAPVYKPPLRGTPGGRVGGGMRGTQGRDIFVLSVLTPEHTGRTTKEQPCLFWFISSPTALPVDLTIVDPNAVEPVVQTRLAAPIKHGVHRVRLADYGVRLSRGIAYQWSVTVVPDAGRRSRDILSSGMIERVDADEKLTQKLSAAGKEDRGAVYAQEGIWYDALEAISDWVDAAPDDPTPRRNRAALLMQARLPELTE